MTDTEKLIDLLIKERALSLYLAEHMGLEAAEIGHPDITDDARDRFESEARRDVERWLLNKGLPRA